MYFGLCFLQLGFSNNLVEQLSSICQLQNDEQFLFGHVGAAIMEARERGRVCGALGGGALAPRPKQQC